MTTPNQTKIIMVIGEIREGRIHSVSMELTSKAHELAQKNDASVMVVFLSDRFDEDPSIMSSYGANHLALVSHSSFIQFDPEVYTNVLVEIIRRFEPEIVLAPATTSGRTYLPAVAAKIHTGLTADCTGLDIDPVTGLLLQTRPAIGGNIIATIKTPSHLPQMATVRPKTFPALSHPVQSFQVEPLSFPESLFRSRLVMKGVRKLAGEQANIQDSELVVAGGKGLKRPDSFDMLNRLAGLLGGSVGASRPTVEAKWIAYPHQVGLSGKVVAPKAYFAIGISGTVQHLAGMQTSEFIIAINKDPEAPIFRVADIGLCGDLFDIVPKLIQALETEKEERL